MRKEIEYSIRLGLIVSTMALTSCSPKRASAEDKFLDAQSTPPTTEINPNLIQTQANPDYIEATPYFIPSPTPENLFIRETIDFGTPGELDVAITKPLDSSISADLKVYPDGLNKDERTAWLKANFKPGDGTFVSDKDGLGNVVLFMHDGYTDHKPLEAEPIRAYIEGFTGKTINDPNHVVYTMQSLVGTNITFGKDGNSSDFTIEAVLRVPNSQMDLYESDTKYLFENAYSISLNADKTKGATDVIKKYVDNGGGLAISICGWGEINGEIYTTYTRYVIFLTPAN